MIITAATRRILSVQTMIRRKGRPLTHRMVWVAAAAACSTSTHAWSQMHSKANIAISSRNRDSAPRTLATTVTSTRLYSSSKNRLRRSDDNETDNELFGFRRGLKSAARKVLPTKWFGTQKEKESLKRKQIVKDRIQGELDQMLKGAPLPIQMLGKYVAAPMMGKIASNVAEAGFQQQEAMEAILDEAKDLLMRDPEITSILGTPIQIGAPVSQRSSTTVINGSRQMRTEFAVELSGPYQTGVSRIIATNEGIGQLLVESNGRVYNVDLTSKGKVFSKRPSTSSPFPRRKKNNKNNSSSGRAKNDDDNIIEAEIIGKDTK